MGLMDYLYKFADEIGLVTLVSSSRDVHLLCAQRFVRMFAYGQVTIILAVFFTSLDMGESKTGLFMTCTLLGDVVISFVLTLVADRVGRRTILALGSLLMCASGVVFSYSSTFWVLLVAAIVGVISPNGNEIGPFRAVEESTLAHLIALEVRADIYAWYALLGSLGSAFGAISSGWIVQYAQDKYNWTAISSYRFIFVIYSVIALMKFAFSVMLSPECELQPVPQKLEPTVERDVDDENAESYPMSRLRSSTDQDEELTGIERDEARDIFEEMDQLSSKKVRPFLLRWIDYFPHLSKQSLKVVAQLIVWFALDSFGSGLATQTWVAYYFISRFDTKEGVLGSLFFTTNIVAAASSLVAAAISKRLGPILTMVGTHLPSSIILMILGFPSSSTAAMILLVVRYCTATMDGAPRQAFLSAIVSSEERTSVMGVVNVVKTLASSAGPSLMGKFASIHKMPIGFLVAGLCKVIYDLGILASFLGVQLHNK
ncbi:major facilitator superfamily domain-containing protein [Myxozyma melibiosi]|uniref:Major facilitator superfamily domain-containing protein n=1 Tax=Myxozyma melibiosi TaxID=54550 RepID=A0ABR1FFU1_9ASCO